MRSALSGLASDCLALLALAVGTGCGAAEPEHPGEERLAQALEDWTRDPGGRPEGAVVPPSGPALPAVVQNPEALSERHLVVLAEADPGTLAPGVERLAGHPDLLRDLQRLPTTLYGGLPPCRELTIAGAFEYDRQARTRACSG